MPTDSDAATAYDRMLSAGEAAFILNVSLPYVVWLADRGKLGSVKRAEDGQRLISAEAVETYRKAQNANARIALEELAAISQKAGVYDSDQKDD